MNTVPIRATDEIRAPYSIETVWGVVRDFASYPRWWPRTVRARVVRGGEDGGAVGTDLEIRPFGGPSFLCRVEAMEPPRRIRMAYHEGLVRGRAEWVLEPINAGTRVAYVLDAQAQGALVGIASLFVDLARVHSWQMRGVLRGLQRELAARDALRRV